MISAAFHKYVLDLFQKKNGRVAYKCQLCPTIGHGPNEIQQHIAAAHEGKKAYACEICHKEFGFSRNKKKHQDLGKCRGNPIKAKDGYVKIEVIHTHFSRIQK